MSAAPGLPAGEGAGERGLRAQSLAPVVAVTLAVAAVLAIYWPTLQSMVAVWMRSDTFAHGVLILPIAFWLLLRQREELARTPARVSWWALLPLALCVFGWLVATMLQADVLRQLAMMAMLPGMVWLLFGTQFLGRLAFTLLFTLLAVPMGEFLVAPMMNLTAWGSVALLTISGIPVFRDGWLITIPAGQFQVAEACSGVRYLIGAVTCGVLFCRLFFSGWKKRLYFMAFVTVLTVMANVLRAYIIILLGHLSDMRLAAGVDHFIYGWFMFVVLLLVAFSIGLRFADGEAQPAGAPGDSGRFAIALRQQPFGHALAAGLALLLLAAGPVGGQWLRSTGVEGVRAVPMRLADAPLLGPAARPDWLRDTPGGWTARHALYGGTVPFELHVFRGDDTEGGADLTSLRDQLNPDGGTLVADELWNPSQAALQVRRMRLIHRSRELTVVYWFDVGTVVTANPVTAKLLEARTMLSGEHKTPALVAIALDTKGLDRPGASLDAIVSAAASSVAHCLGAHDAEAQHCLAF